MFDIISQISISEVVLLFVLLFVIPICFVLVRRLRKYETLYGMLDGSKVPEAGAAAGKSQKMAAVVEIEAAKPAADDGVFPYKARQFLSKPDISCLTALRAALGDEVEVFPRVALRACVESTDKNPAYAARLDGKAYDFLVCDKMLGQPMTAIMYRPEASKAAAVSEAEEMRKILEASGGSLVVIDRTDEYDVDSLKDELGIPELEL